MYIVVAEWEPRPGRESEFKETGRRLTEILRRQPGVLFCEDFSDGAKAYNVTGYESEERYKEILEGDGEFSRAFNETDFENVGRWVRSMRGEAEPH
jgi:hypothetical protein